MSAKEQLFWAIASVAAGFVLAVFAASGWPLS